MSHESNHNKDSPKPLIPKEWLVQCISIPDIEAKYTYDGIVFGFLHNEWIALRSKVLPGDEVWEFSNGPEAWEKLMGICGFALVRHGKVIDMIITELN